MSSLLILGGQRSGKSRYAESVARDSGLSPIYVATAEAGDDEMADRIARHQARRGPGWQTIVAPLTLPETLVEASRPDRYVLVDCLTVWMSNLLHAGQDPDAASDALTEAIRAATGPMALVSNEVGSGIIPVNALARRFADVQGLLNQAVATTVDQVVLIVAGLPLELKPIASEGHSP